MRLIIITTLLCLTGCGTNPRVACNAGVWGAGFKNGGVAENCTQGDNK